MELDGFDILAVDWDDTKEIIQAVVFLIMAVLAGLGSMLKKKAGQGGRPTIPDLDESPVEPTFPPARPPMSSPQAPTLPRSAPAPIRPVLRPQPVQPDAQRPVPPTPGPIRPQTARPPVMRPTPITQPAPPQRATPAQHAAQLAARAEEVARRLAEAKAKEAWRPEAQAPRTPVAEPTRRPTDPRISLILTPASLKQAFVLSEIIRPPLSLREEFVP